MGYKDVYDFHNKFDLIGARSPLLLDGPMFVFRDKFIKEETEEFRVAHEQENLADAFDALIDLVYVIYGTAILMGISPEVWAEGWRRVHEANMKKIRVGSADDSKRGHSFDVKKPVNWVAPKLDDLVKGE